MVNHILTLRRESERSFEITLSTFDAHHVDEADEIDSAPGR